MAPLRDTLDTVVSAVRAAGVAARDGGARALDDAELIAALGVLGEVQRRVEAMVIATAEEIVRRDDAPATEGRLTHRFGCASVSELVQRSTRVAAATAGRWLKVAAAVAERETFHGERLDGDLPELRAALLDGVLGVDGALAIAGPLLAPGNRISRDELRIADAELAATARGESDAGGPPPAADVLRVQAQVWAEALDRDGAEPREHRQNRKRALTLGQETPDGVPVRGVLLPDVAAQLQAIFDAILSPRQRAVAFTTGIPATDDDDDLDAPLDDRTRPQRQHDALATALSVAASSALLPTVGGAAPTLVVSVRADDLAADTGHAYLDGAAVSLVVARHVGCAGVIQRVALGPDGRVLRLGTEDRVFNRHQRRAIALRDGGCIIPGCAVRAAWCEIHHVTEHAAGGLTHTDNGVLLCWHHHRHLDQSGWSIRMNRGVPEVRAPGWYDATRRWRPTTSARTRLVETIVRQ